MQPPAAPAPPSRRLAAEVGGATACLLALTPVAWRPVPTASGDLGAATPHNAPTALRVTLGECFVAPEARVLPAGDVTLIIHNIGRVAHEVEVIRQTAPYQEYETAEVNDVAPGQAATLRVRLEPGTYELRCTIVARDNAGAVRNHCLLGMHATLAVVRQE